MTYDDNEENMFMMKISDDDDECMIMYCDEERAKSMIMLKICDEFE
jgi:hypothetical protein